MNQCEKNKMEGQPDTITIAITAASYSGNKGAAAMLQSSISQLKERYGKRLHIRLMSVYPSEDRIQCPHECVEIVPAQPQRVLFLTFPCAVLYRIFQWCPLIQQMIEKNKMIKAYKGSDIVIDEAGIAFSDSRGFIMNTYSFVCMAIPMLLGIPVVKYSQALGPFHNSYNRILAKWILPKAKLVVARGRITYGHLRAIGIRENVRLYADGAFTMPPAPEVEMRVQDACKKAGYTHLAALSVSAVVARKCRKAGIDYCKIMAQFAAYLAGEGYQVYMFANAARIHSKRERNNDLMIGDAVFEEYQRLTNQKNRLIWEHREMAAEEIRAYIGQCEFLIASRFHAMVFALSKQVPVMLIGWSHKYQEVMEQFGIEKYVADYSQLSVQKLQESFHYFIENQDQIRKNIKRRLGAVQSSSAKNVQNIAQILDETLNTSQTMDCKVPAGGKRYMNHVIDLENPDIYMGKHLACRMGYAADEKIRENAASGGMVTALLCSLLASHEIDGAWVVKTAFAKDGTLTYRTEIATTPQQVCEASSSVYMNIPMLSHIDQLRAFNGRIAVVLTPCRMRAFCRILERDQVLREKVALKIGLFCSGAHDVRATEYALDNCHIPRDGAKRLYYRRGHWRGRSSILYEDGSRKDFSYTKSVCAYKNAYFFIEGGCLNCKDQFAECADISFGDVWLSEVKKAPVKYSGCVIRTAKAYAMLKQAQDAGMLHTKRMTDIQILQSQMRALTFKYRAGRWNHRLAGWLAVKNRKFSIEHPKTLKRVPIGVIYYYMCAIRALLSW